MQSFMIIALTCSVATISGLVSQAHAERCRESNVPVDLHVVNSNNEVSVLAGEHVFVRFCLPDSGPTPSTMLLLVHGITYDHTYWDLVDASGGTDRYSFVAAATKAGYATLAIDRIATGKSSQPLSVLVDFQQNVNVMHQLVQDLRNGTISGPDGPVSFPKVVIVGHSFGAAAAWLEATQFQDVDGIIATGMAHDFRLVAFPFIIPAHLWPAQLDPKFGLLSGLDPGYMTTRPGTRYDSFYAPSTDVDPAMIEQDERDKQTVTDTELVTILNFLNLTPQVDIRVPSLIQMGELDVIFCNQTPLDVGVDCSSPEALVADEAPFYGPNVPCVEATITPGAGHDLNPSLSAPTSINDAIEWLDRIITPGPGLPGC